MKASEIKKGIVIDVDGAKVYVTRSGPDCVLAQRQYALQDQGP